MLAAHEVGCLTLHVAEPPPLQVVAPALVNTKPLQRGEVLVFGGSLDLEGLTSDEEE